MKVNESFAVEATEEVRKDQRFEWYVNWLKSLSNSQWWYCYGALSTEGYAVGIDNGIKQCGVYKLSAFDETLTLDEVYSRYGKEIYEANGIGISTKRGSVVYLGKHKYNDAIIYAQSLGLFIPKYNEMKELVKHFKRSNDYCSLGIYGTSTTYQYDTLCEVTFPKQKEPIPKDTLLDVYGITEMTRADIQLGKFEIYDSVEEWREANGIEQSSVGNTDKPFQGSREYDRQLLKSFGNWCFSGFSIKINDYMFEHFLNNRYPNESILKQIAEKEAEIEELKKQLR